MVTKAELDPKIEGGLLPDKAERAMRSAIAGHPQGAIRRIVLYVTTCIAILVAVLVQAPIAVSVAALSVAFAALLLLAVTDQLA